MTSDLTLTALRQGSEVGDLLVVGPSLGTAVTPLWALCAALLDGDVTVVGWDLPGHGRRRHTGSTQQPSSARELAGSVTQSGL
jgi:alpha-beta hydrolase superfamily lysophospholipase